MQYHLKEEWYTNNTLWDGKDCYPGSKCCDNERLPWFWRTLPQETSDKIRWCTCSVGGDKVSTELLEVFVRYTSATKKRLRRTRRHRELKSYRLTHHTQHAYALRTCVNYRLASVSNIWAALMAKRLNNQLGRTQAMWRFAGPPPATFVQQSTKLWGVGHPE